MRTEHPLSRTPRARRYLFVATVQLTDTVSEAKVQERTIDLSLFGCRRVSYTTSDGGMGIAFTQIEPTNQVILEKWVEDLRGSIKQQVLK